MRGVVLVLIISLAGHALADEPPTIDPEVRKIAETHTLSGGLALAIGDDAYVLTAGYVALLRGGKGHVPPPGASCPEGTRHPRWTHALCVTADYSDEAVLTGPCSDNDTRLEAPIWVWRIKDGKLGDKPVWMGQQRRRYRGVRLCAGRRMTRDPATPQCSAVSGYCLRARERPCPADH